MEQLLTWKSKIFKNKFELFQSGLPVGELKNNSWSRTSYGELNGRKFSFSSKGFINQESDVTDINNNTVIATISFSSWRSKAIINYNNKEYIWKSENLFGNKWSLSFDGMTTVQYQRFNFSGDIGFNIKDELLILAGLYIHNYFFERDE